MTGRADIDVVYCDNHLLAVCKPAGLVTQPSGHHADSQESRAKAWVKREFDKPGNVFLEAVHRIDRLVSGVVLFARTSKALSRLQAAQRARQFDKQYVAVVRDVPEPPSGRLEHALAHGDHRACVARAGDRRARRAVLTYRVLATTRGSALLQVMLETGRYHQIRIQLAENGTPIVGDTRYGGRPARGCPDGAIALHSASLTVPHPTKQEPVTLSVPPPATAPWTWFGTAATSEGLHGRQGDE